MAKKAELLEKAEEMGLEVSEMNTIAEIEAKIFGVSTPETDKAADEKIAKAGKRSAKGLAEAEEKAEKLARQQGDTEEAGEPDEDEEVKKKGPKPKTRPLVERRSKRFQEAASQIDKTREYSLADATELAIKTATTKFDASVELHMRLNVDPKQADQNIRGSVVLPNGTGKTQVVAVFADAESSKDSGADITGEDTIIEKLKKEELDFDVLIATPEYMSKLGKYAKILGPKGMMPNPKSGTVTKDVKKAVSEAKAGKVEFRVDKQGIVHVAVGKTSFGANSVLENVQSVTKAVLGAKPASVKSSYVLATHLTTSMGPSIKVSL